MGSVITAVLDSSYVPEELSEGRLTNISEEPGSDEKGDFLRKASRKDI